MTQVNHAQRAHALLSASGASRWIACTKSARIEEAIRNEKASKGIKETESEFAKEGTAAHELSEILLAHELGHTTKAVKTRALNKFQKDQAQYYSEEMLEYVQGYVDFVMEEVNTARAESGDIEALIEQRLDFSEWVPGGFGTGDMLVLAQGALRIIDLKYGKGIPVSAVENKQMMIYALGAIAAHDWLYEIKEVHMTIVQPRLDSISTYTLTKEELLEWAEKELRPAALLADKGEGSYKAGEHCRFCEAKGQCKARAEQMLEATKQDFLDEDVRHPDLLTNDEIADLLFVVDDIEKWAKDVRGYALNSMKDGAQYDGWKLVEGRANRKYTDPQAVMAELMDFVLMDEKLTLDDVSVAPERAPLAATKLEKALGKKRFNEVVGHLVIKPEGSPTIAQVTDARPELNSLESAAADFLD